MAIERANPYLGEIIEVLDLHLQKYGGDHAKALEHLSKSDSEWIDEQIIMCMSNTRYFLSNFYAIKTEDRGFTGLYPFWDSQEILYEEFERLRKQTGRVRAIVDKARQMGGSTFVSGYIFANTIFTEHINSIVVAQDADQSTYILDMYSAAIDELPWWMRPRIRYKEKGKFIDFDEKDDAVRYTRPGLKTRIYADNGNKPTGAGRGKTFNRGHLDELAFWTEPTQLTKSLFPTFNASDGIYVMISTPNGRNDAWHNLWRKAESGDNDWTPIYVPFYRREKTYSLPIPKGKEFVLTEEEKLIKEQVLLKEKYVIKDEVFNWRRKRIQDFIAIDGDDKMFHQEYSMNAEESFQTSAVTAYPLGIINKLMKRIYNPKWIGEISYDFELGRPKLRMREVSPEEDLEYPKTHNRFSIWKRERPGAKYCLGCDVSLGNEGGDFSTVHVIDISDDLPKDEVVAVWHGYIDPESLAEVVLAIGWMYNEALAAVEVNSMGMVTNNKLVRQYEYENIYRYKHLDKLTHWMTDIIGFWTNEKTKRALMSKMSKTLIDDLLVIPDKFTVDEFYDFTEDGAEGEGARDDLMMSMHIALYCGHENEYKEMREGTKQESSQSQNEFKVMDRFGTIIQSTNSQHEAERVSKKNIGSSIVRTAGATATVNLKGLGKRKVPSDFQNSEWSPVFDGNGIAARMHEDGIQPEDITPEAIQQYEAEQEGLDEDAENSWLYQ